MSSLLHLKITDSATQNRVQKDFYFYSQRIEELKKEISATQLEMEQITLKLMKEVVPLEQKLLKIHVKEISYLHNVFLENDFRKRDNQTLSEIIYERCLQLISSLEDDELESIFEFHNQEKFIEKTEIEVFEEQEIDEKKEIKSKKQLKKEENKRLEEQKLTKTSRQVYVELVKEFHPDREKDELEKERKTLLMHRITEAYEKDDLFGLLHLRLELLGTNLENSPNEQLKYYVKLLKQQVTELEEELKEIKNLGNNSSMSGSFYERFRSTSFQSMESKFKKYVTELKQNIRQAEQFLPAYLDNDTVKYMIERYKK